MHPDAQRGSMPLRYDPRTAAGAIALRPRSAHDVDALRDRAATVHEWAVGQSLADDRTHVRVSRMGEVPSWREHLRRQTERAAKSAKAAPTRSASPAPWYLYL